MFRAMPGELDHLPLNGMWRALSRERRQRRAIPDRPSMSERIGEAALAMHSPRGFMVGRGFYRRRAGLPRVINEAVWFINEDLDPRGGQAGVARALLCLPAWYSLVNEERRAVDLKAGNSAEVPQLGGAQCRRVPADRRSRVGNDQHHRKKRRGGFAIRRLHPNDTLPPPLQSPRCERANALRSIVGTGDACQRPSWATSLSSVPRFSSRPARVLRRS